ncbi:MAG TPA: helix-turn-helix domain-containing protein [Vicinamibacterales bacterium]|nr:helix-turn-helix domain-containing protein [Vicinamibacterales bacterium]
MAARARPAPPPFSTVRDADRAAHLVNPRRGPLLAHLTEPTSAAALARKLGLPRQRLTYHLRELERAGLIECVSRRRKGNCVERLMRVTARAFVISPEASGAIGAATAAPDRLSAAAQLQAAARTIQEVAALDARATREGKRLATLTLDTVIRFANPADRRAFTEEITDTIARLAARYHNTHARGGRSFRLVVCAHPTADNAPGAAPETGASRE